MEKNNRLGIKVYLGAGPTVHNLHVAFDKSFNLGEIENKFKNSEARKFFYELEKLKEPIFAWAGVARVEKKIQKGDLFIFIITSNQTAYLFEYLGGFYDKDLEVQKYVGWQGRGYENVVFFKNKKVYDLNDKQMEELKKLIEWEYHKKGFAGYIHKLFLFGETQDRVIKIINQL